ncbi:hypothetical protein ACWE42_16690 [Sutcliffiella cohnii]
MESNKMNSTVSKVVGVLVNSESNTLEVIEVLEKAKQTLLERSRHINSDIDAPEQSEASTMMLEPRIISRIFYRIEQLEREVRLLKNKATKEDFEYFETKNAIKNAVKSVEY